MAVFRAMLALVVLVPAAPFAPPSRSMRAAPTMHGGHGHGPEEPARRPSPMPRRSYRLPQFPAAPAVAVPPGVLSPARVGGASALVALLLAAAPRLRRLPGGLGVTAAADVLCALGVGAFLVGVQRGKLLLAAQLAHFRLRLAELRASAALHTPPPLAAGPRDALAAAADRVTWAGVWVNIALALAKVRRCSWPLEDRPSVTARAARAGGRTHPSTCYQPPSLPAWYPTAAERASPSPRTTRPTLAR
jgi:hypothetical protein